LIESFVKSFVLIDNPHVLLCELPDDVLPAFESLRSLVQLPVVLAYALSELYVLRLLCL
jgi:hypothetical protein